MSGDVEALAQAIRVADGNHDLGAGALAEALLPWLAEQIAAAEQRGREGERERIAQAIEARRGTLHNAGAWEDLTIAARIAREGGGEERSSRARHLRTHQEAS